MFHVFIYHIFDNQILLIYDFILRQVVPGMTASLMEIVIKRPK